MPRVRSSGRSRRSPPPWRRTFRSRSFSPVPAGAGGGGRRARGGRRSKPRGRTARSLIPRRSPKRLLLSSGVRRAVLAVPFAEEAGELGGERVARGEIGLVELVRARLQLVDIGLGIRVGRNRTTDLLDVALGRLLELLHVDLDLEQRAESFAECERGSRARRERDVVG